MNKKLCKKILWVGLILLVIYFLSNLYKQNIIEGIDNCKGGTDTVDGKLKTGTCSECEIGYMKEYVAYRTDKCVKVYSCTNGIPENHPTNRPGKQAQSKASIDKILPITEKCRKCNSGYELVNNKCLKKIDGCTYSLPYSWNDEIIRGSDLETGEQLDNDKKSKETPLEICRKRCKNDYECDYFKYYPKSGCHIFRKIHKKSKKMKDDVPVCKIKRKVHKFTTNENTFDCMSEKGRVFGTKIIGGIDERLKKYVSTGPLQYEIKGTDNITNKGVNECHTSCFKNETCKAYSWIPTTKEDEVVTSECKGTDKPITKKKCDEIDGDFTNDKCLDVPIENKEKCEKGGKNEYISNKNVKNKTEDDIDTGKCYHFNKSHIKNPRFREFTIEYNGEKYGASANKEVCMKKIKQSDIIKYTDMTRGEFNKWPCGTMCKKEKYSNNISGKLRKQRDIIDKLILDVRYHSSLILINDSTNEDIKGIYMLDIDKWITERKKFIFEKKKNELNPKPLPNFSEKYGHRLIWKNKKNNGVSIIVNIKRDNNDIIEDIINIMLVKDSNVLSETNGFFSKWTDPFMNLHFMGWNKESWRISPVNTLRKLESKVSKYNYCNEKMKGDNIWGGDEFNKCGLPNTKRYDNKGDVTLSNIEALSKQQTFMRRLEYCTSSDGDIDICRKLEESLQLT